MLIIILLMYFVWMFFQDCTMHYGPDSWVVMFSCMGIQSRGTPTFLCIIFNHYFGKGPKRFILYFFGHIFGSTKIQFKNLKFGCFQCWKLLA